MPKSLKGCCQPVPLLNFVNISFGQLRKAQLTFSHPQAHRARQHIDHPLRMTTKEEKPQLA
jgi:hypothetical protein